MSNPTEIIGVIQAPVEIIGQLSTTNIEVSIIGSGPVGPQGTPGETPVKGVDYFTQEEINEITDVADKTFVHTEGVPTNIWVIIHNLNKYPSVTIIDSSDRIVIGDIKYDSINQVTISFEGGGFSGKAYLN